MLPMREMPILPGKEQAVRDLTIKAQQVQDELNMGYDTVEDLSTHAALATRELHAEAIEVYGGEDVEVSGHVWRPRVEDGSLTVRGMELVRGYFHGIAAGFRCRVEVQDVSWMSGYEAVQPRAEIAHAVFIGENIIRSWVGEEMSRLYMNAPISTATIDLTSDSNFRKHRLVAEAINFNDPEAGSLGEILLEANPSHRLPLLAQFFEALAAKYGAFHPKVNTYLRYVTHGMGLERQHAQVMSKRVYVFGKRGTYVPVALDKVIGTFNGLCFVPKKLLSDATVGYRESKQGLFLSMSVEADTHYTNIMIPVSDIKDYNYLRYDFDSRDATDD